MFRFPPILALLLFLTARTPAHAAPSAAAPEDSAKAAHLLLFLRYVTWPDSAFPSKATPFRACVLGTEPIGDALTKAFKDSRAQGRALEVRRVRGQDEARECQIAYIGARHAARWRAWNRRLGSRPVLTVTDGDEEGIAVAFVMEGERLRYEVDLGAAERAGLKIAAPMLISARKVRPSGSAPGEAP